MWWILVAVVVLALAVYAFWPRKRGIADGKVSRSRAVDHGKAQPYSGPDVPHM